MPLNFPSSPSPGDSFTSGSLVYVFDGLKWVSETTIAIQNSFANANAAFDRANVANNIPVQKTGTLIGARNRLNFLDGSGATVTITDDAAGDRINVSIASTGGGGGDIGPAFDRANVANQTANIATIVASAAFDRANVANNLPVQKSGTVIGTRNRINFIEGSSVTINVVDDSVGDRVNVTISSTGGGGGGGSEITIFDRVSANYTMSSSNQAVIGIANIPITITLPDAITVKSYFFQNMGSNTMTLQTINSQLINNDQSLILAFNSSSCRLVSNGVAYLIF